MKLLTHKLKQLRAAKGLKQKDIADILGLSVSGYHKIESGYNHVSPEHLSAIAKILKVSENQLVNEESTEEEDTAQEYENLYQRIIALQEKCGKLELDKTLLAQENKQLWGAYELLLQNIATMNSLTSIFCTPEVGKKELWATTSLQHLQEIGSEALSFKVYRDGQVLSGTSTEIELEDGTVISGIGVRLLILAQQNYSMLNQLDLQQAAKDME